MDGLIEVLDLTSVSLRLVSYYGVSVKDQTNLDAVLGWIDALVGKRRGLSPGETIGSK